MVVAILQPPGLSGALSYNGTSSRFPGSTCLITRITTDWSVWLPLGTGRGVGGHAGCGQPEREPLYSEQELTAQTLSTFLREGRELGWGRPLHLSKQFWGPGQVQLPGELLLCSQGAGWVFGGGTGRHWVSNC